MCGFLKGRKAVGLVSRQCARRRVVAAGWLVLGLLVGLTTAVKAQTTTLGASADTYLRSGSANQNQGSDTILRVQQ
ncbi:MAG: hypothetical protein HY699_22080, partial [Deltaproteobacteria bacterium]|nr:hypothetical protein [Deltaproteobacteria bacterium]